MNCYKCGAKLVGMGLFCRNCGAKQEDAPSTNVIPQPKSVVELTASEQSQLSQTYGDDIAEQWHSLLEAHFFKPNTTQKERDKLLTELEETIKRYPNNQRLQQLLMKAKSSDQPKPEKPVPDRTDATQPTPDKPIWQEEGLAVYPTYIKNVASGYTEYISIKQISIISKPSGDGQIIVQLFAGADVNILLDKLVADKFVEAVLQAISQLQ